MRIVVHDFAGHPFQVQLSRELARRGHDVLHLHCASLEGAKGALQRSDDDSKTFQSEGVALRDGFEKYSAFKRWRQEREYGELVLARVRDFDADVVISANTPLFAQRVLQRGVRRTGGRFVFWQQDVVGVAMQQILARKLPVVGGLLGRAFPLLERKLVAGSDEVVAITEDFVPLLERWGVSRSKIHVIENWAPLEELPVMERDNPWARERGLVDKTVFLYAGTLGLKHNPALLLELAKGLREDPGARLVVISEGPGAEWLRPRVDEAGLTNLLQLPYQPYDRLPEVLATGDVLIAILEADAGVFSVPSKVLSYLCAGRAILGAMPLENLAARTLQHASAGSIVPACAVDPFVDAGKAFAADPKSRLDHGAAARAFAERVFDIASIADRFESIFSPGDRVRMTQRSA